MTVHVRQSKTRKRRDRILRKGCRRQPPLLKALADLPRTECDKPEKVRYRSWKAAETAADKQWWAERRLLRPYPCGNHFHLTSKVHRSGKVKATSTGDTHP